MELVSKMISTEQRREPAVRTQEALFFPARKKKVGSTCGIQGPDQDERIVIAPGFAPPRSENRAVFAPVPDPREGKWPGGSVNRRAECASKNK